MRTTFLLMAFAAIFACHTTASAQPADELHFCEKAQSVYFGNGVGTFDATVAQNYMEALRVLLQKSLPKEKFDQIHFGVAFNHSVNKISDFLESARQIIGNEYPTLVIEYMLGRTSLPFLTDDERVQLNDLLANAAVKKLVGGTLSESDIVDHVTQYRRDLANGRNVVVVAHSQGNLFVNLAFLRLSSNEQRYFAMVPVASPDSIARRSIATPDHVTFVNDRVILGVQALRAIVGLPSVLPPNQYDDNPSGWSVHEFVGDYLADPESRRYIIDAVAYSLDNLSKNQTRNSYCLANFDTYLPKVLAGRISTVSSCGPAKTFGAISISQAGEYTGSGCYASLSFGPYRSTYEMVVGPGVSLSGEAGVHKSFRAPNVLVTRNIDKLFVRGGVSPATSANAGATFASNVPDIDPAKRMTGWLDFISRRPCYASYPGQVAQPAYVERSANDIAIKSGNTTLLSAKLSDALDAPPSELSFHELFRNNNSLLVTYWHVSEPLNNTLTLTSPDPEAANLSFAFSLSKNDATGKPRAMTCKK